MGANFGPAQVFQPLSAVTLWRDDVIVKFFDRSVTRLLATPRHPGLTISVPGEGAAAGGEDGGAANGGSVNWAFIPLPVTNLIRAAEAARQTLWRQHGNRTDAQRGHARTITIVLKRPTATANRTACGPSWTKRA